MLWNASVSRGFLSALNVLKLRGGHIAFSYPGPAIACCYSPSQERHSPLLFRDRAPWGFGFSTMRGERARISAAQSQKLGVVEMLAGLRTASPSWTTFIASMLCGSVMHVLKQAEQEVARVDALMAAICLDTANPCLLAAPACNAHAPRLGLARSCSIATCMLRWEFVVAVAASPSTWSHRRRKVEGQRQRERIVETLRQQAAQTARAAVRSRNRWCASALKSRATGRCDGASRRPETDGA